MAALFACICSGNLCAADAVKTGEIVSEADPRILPVENARRNIERHEWARQLVEREKTYADRFYMNYDREFYEKMIPDLTPGNINDTTCPVCIRKNPSLMGRGFWQLNASFDKIVCRRCDTQYPNEEYPETGVLELPRMGQTFTYYQTPEEREAETLEERRKHALRRQPLATNGMPWATSFSSILRSLQLNWARDRALGFARLYAFTGDIAYAERTAWVLQRLAQTFPNYLYYFIGGSYADLPPEEAAEIIGRDGRLPPEVIISPYGDTRPRSAYRILLETGNARALWQVIQAYDLIRDAKYPDGAPLLDSCARESIMNNLIVAGYNDIRHYRLSAGRIRIVAATGILTEDHELMRAAIKDFHTKVESFFHFDGLTNESPSYLNHRFGWLLDIADLLAGYSDPPDYIPSDGRRIEDYDPFREGLFSHSLVNLYEWLTPGYFYPPFGNSREIQGDSGPVIPTPFVQSLAYHVDGRFEVLLGKILKDAPAHRRNQANEYALWRRPADMEEVSADTRLPERKSQWFPGWHVGVLRGGRPDKTALYLTGAEDMWTAVTWHRQADLLSLCYFEFGRQVATDPGWGQVTHFNYQTITHNTVVVDGTSQTDGYFGTTKGSHLELFGIAPGLEVVQARGYRLYEQCDRYMRTSALIKTSGGDSTYVADFFRVRGGEKHQYSFHGVGDLVNINPPDKPASLEGAISVSPRVRNPEAVLHNLRQLGGATPYTFTWEKDGVSLDLMLLNDDMTRIVIADSPQPSRVPLYRIPNPPHLERILAEKRAPEGSNDLETNYAAVIVPHKGTSPVLSARLIADGSDAGALAMEVRFADRTDYIISTLDQRLRQYGPVSAAGRFAYVSVDSEGNAVQGYLLAGTKLACGKLDITLEAPEKTLQVSKVSDRTIYLAEPLPEGWGLPGTYLLSSGPAPRNPEDEMPQTGFRIESATADTITVEDYPVQPTEEVILLNSKWVE